MKKVIIIGATSGIGEEIAKIYIAQGWQVGIAGRREEALTALAATAPAQVKTQVIDVTSADAPEQLKSLIEKLGGMDLFLLSSGIGSQNVKLEPEIELNTARTNVEGFIRMVTAAYRFFKEQGSGHLAVISSVAGTKGLGSAPAQGSVMRLALALHDRDEIDQPVLPDQYWPAGTAVNQPAKSSSMAPSSGCSRSPSAPRPA